MSSVFFLVTALCVGMPLRPDSPLPAAAAASGPIPGVYTLTDLGEGEAYGLNDDGAVVGDIKGGNGFLYQHGQLTDLGPGFASGISQAGLVVGGRRGTGAGGNSWGINGSGTAAAGIAPQAGIIDPGYGPTGYPAVWTESAGWSSLYGAGCRFPGVFAGRATAVQNMPADGKRLVVGQIESGSFSETTTHAFRCTPDNSGNYKPFELNLPGSREGAAYAINDAGQIAGKSDSSGTLLQAIRWEADGTPVALGFAAEGHTIPADFPAQSVAYGISGNGDVVGSYGPIATSVTLEDDSPNNRAFIWRNSSRIMEDLTDLLEPNSGWVLNFATAVNNRGQIVGQGRINGQRHAFLLSPNGKFDIIADRVVLTQVVQNEENLDLLVGDKQTFAIVRAHTERGTALGVTATLHGSRDGTDLGDIPPVSPRIDVTHSPDPSNVNHSFVFALPRSWAGTGKLTLRAKVNPDFAVQENILKNNETPETTVTFMKPPTLEVAVLDTYYIGDALPTNAAYDVAYQKLSSYVARAFPIASLGGRHYPVSRAVMPPGTNVTRSTCGQVLDSIALLRPHLNLDSQTILYGQLPPKSDGTEPYDARGCSWVPSTAATGWTGAQNDMVAAHELAHAIGRNHVPACNAKGSDVPGYPFITDTSAPVYGGSLHLGNFSLDGDIDLGFDGQKFLPSKSPQDIMTYCWNGLPDTAGWMSDYTYENLYSQIPTVGNLTTASLQRSIAAGTDAMHVVGSINLADETAGIHLERSPQPQTVSFMAEGPYHVQLFDASNNRLADYPFTPSDNGPALSSGSELPESFIDQVVPFSSGATRLAIYSDHSGKEIATATISANAPTVIVNSPAPGTALTGVGPLTIGWTGSDADNDQQTYTVLYSANDGESWQPLADGITDNSINVDASQLPGTVKARVKVIANDGVNTASAEINGLTAPPKPPTVMIDRPADATAYTTDQAVLLQGSADDPQDGNLGDTQLTWSSDRDGQLGTGTSVLATRLSVGTHTITLTATDSAGQTSRTSTHITITGSGRPGPTLGLSSQDLNFTYDSGNAPGPQPLGIDNLGSGDVQWTAATDDPRVSFDTSSGSAPAEIQVAVDTHGLPAGAVFVAHATIKAAGAANSSQVVTVTAQSSEPTVSLSRPKVDFGSQIISGTSTPQPVTFTYHGAGSLHLAPASLAGGTPEDFALANDTCSNATIASGAGCTLNVGFQPSKAGQRTGYLIISDLNSSDRWYLPLSGVGAGLPAGQAGSLAGWGNDEFGQAGTTPPTAPCKGCEPVPNNVPGLSHVTAVTSGNVHSMALTTDGSVWTWGSNCSGDLGNGAYDDCTAHPTPQQVSGLNGVTGIAAGDGYNLALKGDGTVWTWGADTTSNGTPNGVLGDGCLGCRLRPSPVQVRGPAYVGYLDHIIAVAAGSNESDGTNASYALRDDGTVWMWGSRGPGSSNNTLDTGPIQIAGPSGQGVLTGMVAIAHGMALKADGTVWTWGEGADGQLGNGLRPTQSQVPVQVLDPNGTQPLNGVVAVASRSNQRYALKNDGTVMAWGSGRSMTYTSLDAGVALGIGGEHPDGTAIPMPVVGTDGTGHLNGVTAIQPGIALRSDGTAWTWGRGTLGGLGDGTYIFNPWSPSDPQGGSPTPVQVHGVGGNGYLTGIAAITGGDTQFAISGATGTPSTLSAGPSLNLSATEGTTSVQTVASFVDSDPKTQAQAFTATIDWGDNTPATSGTITGSNGQYTVSGTHAYTRPGTYNVKVESSDRAGNAVTLTATAIVADAALTAAAPFNVQTIEGSQMTATGTFTDAASSALDSNFTATISWGDNTPNTAGTVTGPPGGPFAVGGFHTFTAAGNYNVKMEVTDRDGSRAAINGTAVVADAPLTAIASYTTAYAQGNAFNGPLALFNDSNPTASATDLTGRIDWGDGSSSTGTVGGAIGGPFTVNGSHTYTTIDPKSVTVTLSDPAGGAASTTTTLMGRYPHTSLTETVDHSTGAAPLTSTFTYRITNDGQDSLFGVSVTSSVCGQATYQSGDNANGVLDAGESWTFTCQHLFPSAGTFTDTALARATELLTGVGISSPEGTSTVTVTASLDHLLLVPATGSAPAGAGIIYKAEGIDAAGNDLGDFTSATIFTISPDGECKANACSATIVGPHKVKGVSNGKTGTADLAIVGGPIDHFRLSPASSTAAAGVSQTYQTEGFDRFNNDLGDVTAATTFTLTPDGSCTKATCVATTPGPHTVEAVQPGIPGASAQLLVYGVSTGGTFAITGSAETGSHVTFWADQWAQKNPLSHGSAPETFKGFAASVSNLQCGSHWSSKTGNSSHPPNSIPTYMLIMVTSTMSFNRSSVSGDAAHLVIIKTDPGYSGDPSHPGTGTIVARLC